MVALVGTAVFVGASSLQTSGSKIVANRVHARLGAIGEFSLGQQQTLPGRIAVFNGASAMLISANFGYAATSAFTGGGSLSANAANFGLGAFADFSSSSTLAANATFQNHGTNPATLPGQGRLCVHEILRKAAPGRTENRTVTGPGTTNNVVV